MDSRRLPKRPSASMLFLWATLRALLALAVAACAITSGHGKKGTALSDEVKASGDDAKAEEITSEVKDTLQEKTNEVNDQIVEAQNQGVNNTTVSGVDVSVSGSDAFGDGENAGEKSVTDEFDSGS